MKKTDHPFYPVLQPVFSSQAVQAASKYQPDSRHLFYHLIHISVHYEVMPIVYQFVKQHLTEASGQNPIGEWDKVNPDDKITELVKDFVGWAKRNVPNKQAKNTIRQVADVYSHNLQDTNIRASLIQSAPIIMTEPCWLQNISQAATCEKEIAVRMMSVYLHLIRGEQGSANAADLYRALLAESGVELPAMHSSAFVEHQDISDCIFDLAAIQLALAQFPRVFFPEILGFTLAYLYAPLLIEQLLSAKNLSDKGFSTDFFSVRQALIDSQKEPLIQTIKLYLRLFDDQSGVLLQRIQTGLRLYQQQFERCFLETRLRQRCPLSPQQELARVLKQKASAAFGHHSQIQLGEKSPHEWFSDSPFDSEKFLTALKQSSYVNIQNPADSPLLKLFDFKGPMFGVLDQSERKILEAWLVDKETGNQITEQQTSISSEQKERIEKIPVEIDSKSSGIDYAKLSNRELYYYLINADLYPEVLETARAKARQVLKSAGLFNRPPFKYYEHKVFDQYLQTIYQREIKAYQPLTGKPKFSRAAYVWGIEQLAPTILTDGCWLQGVSQLKYFSNHAIGDILFRIYCDEIGNGIPEQNHPLVYRQLLDSLDIELPPVHSREFIEHKGFFDSAFDIAVYLLSISRFPSHFLPEILGLNLAIELGGLGKVYMRLADELKYWDIDPMIVNLHISIDNFASGHSALAKQAIKLYLDDISASCGEQEMQRHWCRIYTGFCSLSSAGRRFKYRLVLHYLMKRMLEFFMPHNNGTGLWAG